ncbi:hypothetical protein I4U23_029032 [Adineta vaga]|nr:hypothetical protein I4U23_029032 [Adineta vaga]
MQQLSYEKKYCEAREIITDKELRRLTDKYHVRHPTFSIDIQERTCKTIILACIYHYRHIEMELTCQCIYNDLSRKFQSIWSTDKSEYKKILDEIFINLNSRTAHRIMDDQIEEIIEQITKYFMGLKPIEEEEEEEEEEGEDHTKQNESRIQTRKNSISILTCSPIEIVKYERSPQSRRRRQLVERSLSWSQPLTAYPIYNSMNSLLVERKKKQFS